MSEFMVEVVEIGGVEPHENADNLEVTEVLGSPCIIKKGSLKTGDLAVYVPVDSVVPTGHPAFLFLKKGDKESERIKAIRLRGIFSMGLLIPLEELGITAQVGDDLAEKLGIVKYEQPEPRCSGGAIRSGNQASPPEVSVPIYGIENLRKYGNKVFDDGDMVVITEKIHGTNARFVSTSDGQVHIGSHRTWKKLGTNSTWEAAAEKYCLGPVLKALPNLVLFGEVYGPVQDMKYGSPSEVRLAFFDAYNSKTGEYMDWVHFKRLCEVYGLPMTPVLYEGPYSKAIAESLLSGPTMAWHGEPGTEPHFREGIVVKTMEFKPNRYTGRSILKFVSPEYLLRKNGTEFH